MAPSPKRTYNITSVQRCLRLLSLFAQTADGLSASEVAKQSGLPVSTVHRFLVNLENAGFLAFSNTGRYHLGIASFSIGHAARAQLDIRRLSYPYLQELNQITRETVHLIVRHGLSAVYVEKLDSLEKLRIFSHVGASVPLYCTAVGKVMLAYLPEKELEETLRQIELREMTPNTITDLKELQRHLERVRKNGYAFDLEEHELHIRCVAAPIWDASGVVNATLSLTAPVVRMSLPRLRKLAPLVQDVGLEISRDLGYRSSGRVEDSMQLERRAGTQNFPITRSAVETTLR